ncbi:MAG TPA: tyrosine-type recombinase/integrase [Pirellulales bacterium]|jgi:integrase
MARASKPWWREDRQAWFVTIDGQRYNLGPDEGEAHREFHRLLSLAPAVRTPKASPSTGLTVADVLDKYLDWCQKHRAPRTFDWYRDHLQSFTDFLSKPDEMLVADLKPYQVVEWIDQYPSWGANYRRGALIAVQRPFNWATKVGYINASPIPHIEKPQPTRREQAVTPDEWESIRDHYREGDPFRDLLEFAWETGCRPQEVKAIEARHIQLAQRRVLFPAAEAKGKKRIRIIYMTARAEGIIRRLLKLYPNELLFRNSKGRGWNYASMNCRFSTLKKHLGVKYCGYALRHGFATRKLESGLDHITVAALMGHADATMLSKVYSHIGDRHDHLRDQLNRESVDGRPNA